MFSAERLMYQSQFELIFKRSSPYHWRRSDLHQNNKVPIKMSLSSSTAQLSAATQRSTFGAWRVVDRFGLDQLRYQEVERGALRAGEARVRITHSALNYRDLMMVEGQYNPRQPLPLIPCSDGVGVITEVSEGSTLEVGQRVIPLFSQGWASGEPSQRITQTTLGGPLAGTLSEEGVFHERGLVPAPSYLSDPEASTLGCAALTAWSALIELGQLKPGAHVLCIGTGGVSLFAAQIAALTGARITLTSRSEEKLDAALNHPALTPFAHAITPHCIAGEERWGRVIRSRFGEVDHVVEVGGAGTLDQSLSATRPGGTISLIGVLAGGASKVNLTPVLMRQIKIQGVIVGHREGMLRMLKAFTVAQVRPLIAQHFELAQAVEAFTYLREARHIGKIVLNH